MTRTVRVEPLTESDLESVRRFQRAQVSGFEANGEALNAAVETARWYLFENPDASDVMPRGFVARNAAGDVVGAMQCSPQRFCVGGHEFLLLCSGGYYVDHSYRGVGIRLMRALLDADLGVAHFASTMNEVSGAIYERYGGYAIPHTEHEMIGVLRWRPFVEEVLARRFGASALSRVASLPAAAFPSRTRRRGTGELREISSPSELEGISFETPPEHARQITASRDMRFLRWRYFEGPDRSRRAFVYVHPSGVKALVTTRLELRGVRGQIRTRSVLDYWGALPEEAIREFAGLLAERFYGEADLLVFRGQPPGRQAVLRKAGFLRRLLPRSIGVCIDPAGRLPTREWYMVPADGDMSI